jgi:hypothetical protein
MTAAIKNRKNTENLRGKGNPGRPKGSVNKVPAAVKEMVIEALGQLGGVAYLVKQGRKNNAAPFLALVAKVLPLQIQGDKDNPLRTITEVRETIVDPGHPSSEGAETSTGSGQV